MVRSDYSRLETLHLSPSQWKLSQPPKFPHHPPFSLELPLEEGGIIRRPAHNLELRNRLGRKLELFHGLEEHPFSRVEGYPAGVVRAEESETQNSKRGHRE